MYFRLELEPETQYFTVIIGTDGLPYFLFPDVVNVLKARNPDGFSHTRLEMIANRAEMIPVKQILPTLPNHSFKFENLYTLSVDNMLRVMELYVKVLDPGLYLWFIWVWASGSVWLINPEVYEEVLKQPWLSEEKMPRFRSHPVHEERLRGLLKISYLPLLVHVTLGYYRALELLQQQGMVLLQPSTGEGPSVEEDISSAWTDIQTSEAMDPQHQFPPKPAVEQQPLVSSQTSEAMDEDTSSNVEPTSQQHSPPQPAEEQTDIDQVESSIAETEMTQAETEMAQSTSGGPIVELMEIQEQQQQQGDQVRITSCMYNGRMLQVGMVNMNTFPPDYIIATQGERTMTYQPVCGRGMDAMDDALKRCLMDCDDEPMMEEE